MSLQDALREIESHDFSARLGVANNMAMFLALAERESSVGELIRLLKEPDNANRLLSHVASVLQEQEDVRYRNSRDTAVAVCLWALKQDHPSLAKLLASNVVSEPRLWWARRMAGDLEGRSLTTSESSLVVNNAGWTNVSSQGKEVLVVPQTRLVTSGHIAGANTITATSDARGSSSSLPGEMTSTSSLSGTVTKVV